MWPFTKKKTKERKTLNPTRSNSRHGAGTSNQSDTDTTTPFILGMMMGGDDTPAKSPPPDIAPAYDGRGFELDSGGYDGGSSDSGGCDCGGGDGGGGD